MSAGLRDAADGTSSFIVHASTVFRSYKSQGGACTGKKIVVCQRHYFLFSPPTGNFHFKLKLKLQPSLTSVGLLLDPQASA